MKSKSDDGKAALERENAELRRRLDESLAQQDAVAEVLRGIAHPGVELAVVLQAVVSAAHRLCRADYAVLFRSEGGVYRWAAGHAIAGGSEKRERDAAIHPGTGTLIGRAVLEGRAVQNEDALTDPNYEAKEDARKGGIRTMLGVPLMREGEAIGAIGLARGRVEPFTDKQIALVESFAAQAVIAIENARLLTETRESLERQTATSEILRVIAASPGDAEGTLRKIAETTMRLFNAAGASFRIADGDAYSSAIIVGRGAEDVSASLSDPDHLVRPRTLPGTVIHENRLIHLPDLDNLDPAFVDWPGPPVFRALGMRTLIGTPLRRLGRAFGALVVYRDELRPFAPDELQLLQSFADQAVIAMENARLITETREALEQQTATAEVLQVINSSPGDLAPVFEAMLDKALQLCAANFGYLLTYNGEGLVPVADRGNPAFSAWVRERGKIVPEPGTINARIVDGGEDVVQVADVINDPFYQGDTAMRRAVVEIGGFRTVLTVALRKDGALLGVIHIYRQEVRPFSDRQIALLQNFAAQAVIAIENARLITETREALERQTAISEVLAVMSSSAGELQPVFDTVLANAVRICGGAFGLFGLWQNDGFRGVSTAGVGAVFADTLSRIRHPPPGTSLNLAQLTRQTVHQPDCAADAAYDPVRAFNPDFVEVRTNLTVPMLREGEFIGALAIYRHEVRPFDPKQIELVENFAKQAVIAIENTRLITETREALEQQTATAEVLGVINSSPGNLGPVFEAMLDKAVGLCDAADGVLRTFDGEFFHLAAMRGEPDAIEGLKLLGAIELDSVRTDDMLGSIVRGDTVVHIADVRDTETHRNNPIARKRAEAANQRTWLAVALRREGALLGVIMIYRTEVRPFTEKQIALLQNFAAQAVIAMENARLITETREALEQQTATAEVLQVINSSPGDLAPVFDAMLEKGMELCQADAGGLGTWHDDAFEFLALRGLSPAYAEFAARNKVSPGPRDGFVRIAQGSGFVHLSDASTSKFYDAGDLLVRGAVDLDGARTTLTVPLAKDDEVLGIYCLYRRQVREFTDRQIALVKNFAQQAVIAMENARLLGELRQRTEEVAELNRGLEARVAEQVDELGRVGRLKRFLAPQLAELIVSQGDEKILESHRREIVVVFCDLRGYTAFTETAEPEEVLDFLREYHGALGPLVAEYEGTLDQFSGDGIMVFFNDPVPIPDPAERAVRMAMAMREAAGALTAVWRRRGRELGFGAGIAQGYATLGQIGFSERSGYTAIGTVCNVAARLCAEAKDGQILIAQRVAAGLDGDIALEDMGPLPLKGITQPVVALNVAPAGAGAGRLRLIEP